MLAALHKWMTVILLAVLCLALRPDALDLSPPPGRMNALPVRTLWVWERPEDLSSIDPSTTAIAALDRTILLGRQAILIPRRQSFVYPSGVRRISVVRIEAPGPIAPGLEQATADLVLDSLQDRDLAALQIDFDARRSQQAFYRAVLREVRRRMPPRLPLSITALASWCSSDDWLAGLPVDEAVPMFFRMEPDRRGSPPDLPWFHIREPLCMGSIGISTREPHSISLAAKRVYVFPDRGWRDDLPLLAQVAPAQRNHP